jgi:hypothetical protein
VETINQKTSKVLKG